MITQEEFIAFSHHENIWMCPLGLQFIVLIVFLTSVWNMVMDVRYDLLKMGVHGNLHRLAAAFITKFEVGMVVASHYS